MQLNERGLMLEELHNLACFLTEQAASNLPSDLSLYKEVKTAGSFDLEHARQLTKDEFHPNVN